MSQQYSVFCQLSAALPLVTCQWWCLGSWDDDDDDYYVDDDGDDDYYVGDDVNYDAWDLETLDDDDDDYVDDDVNDVETLGWWWSKLVVQVQGE